MEIVKMGNEFGPPEMPGDPISAGRPRLDYPPAFVRRLAEQDEEAWEQFVRETTGRWLSVAFLMLGNRDDAMEAVQVSMIKAWERFESFHQQSTLMTWVYSIVVNTCFDMNRSRSRRRTYASIDDLPDDAISSNARQLDGIAQNEMRQMIQSGLQQLDKNFRAVIVLRDFEDLSVRETAEVLRIPENTVKTRHSRALAKLRVLLDGQITKADTGEPQ